MRSPWFIGDAVNASRIVAVDIASANSQIAWAALGRAYATDKPQRELDKLKRIARDRQRKLNRAYDLEFGNAMRIRAVV